ncbi:hypothetical protein BX600DRAFT_439758 [Xylariales sp. PMI_506]|nr:hypothetical protein BX600DRAFT_439758 [Xylariales sp. PMI_506]
MNWDIGNRGDFTIEWEGHNGAVDINLLARQTDGQWSSFRRLGSDNTDGSFKWVKQADGQWLTFRRPHSDDTEGSFKWERGQNYLPEDTEYKIQVVDAEGKWNISPKFKLPKRQEDVTSDLNSFTTSTLHPSGLDTTDPSAPTSITASQTSDITSDTGATTSPAVASNTGEASTSVTKPVSSFTISNSANISPTSSSDTGGSSGGLSGGAYAGIGVAATVGVILVAVGIWWATRRHYRSKNKNAEAEVNSGGGLAGKSELHGQSAPAPASELGAHHYWQPQAGQHQGELHGQPMVSEMEAPYPAEQHSQPFVRGK